MALEFGLSFVIRWR